MADNPRRSYLRRTAVATVAGGVALSMTLADGAVAQDDGAGDTLIVGTTDLSAIPHMNPLDSGWLIQGELNNLMYAPLIRWDQDDYSPVPGIAQEWESSEDELTWTYELNPDATFSDGEPITAHDAEFTLNLIQEESLLASRHSELVGNIESVTAEDDHTLVIDIAEPNSVMQHLTGVSVPIVPEHVWSEIDDPADYQGEPGQPTSGAFELSEYSEGERVVLTANEDYWDGPVDYDEFVLQNYETSEAMVQALQNGDLDLVGGLNPQQYEAIAEQDHVATNTGPGRRMHSLTFNAGAATQDGQEFGNGHPALQDAAVRRAIAHVIDKEQLIDVAMDGHAVPGISYVPPIFNQFSWDPGDDLIEVSAEEGNDILDEAGYDERDSNGIRIDPESGEPLTFRLFYHSDRPDYANLQEFIVSWVGDLDIELDAEALDTDLLNDEQDAGNFDIAFGTWSAGPDPSSSLVYHTCARLPEEAEPTDLTFGFYCNEEYDEMYFEQLREGDLDARAEVLQDMQRHLYEEVPAIQLYYENQLEAYNADLWTGFETQPIDDGMIREQQGAYGYESATPADQAEGASDDGAGALPWIAGAVALVVVAGGAVVMIQRRKTSDERE